VSFYQPHPKQADFHAAGALFAERVLMAGNRQGKTHAGGAEFSYHITGRYPDWWEGHVRRHPGRYWACGVSREKTRDVVQRKLLGDAPNFSNGFIPEVLIKDVSMSRVVTAAVDFAKIRHRTGSEVWLSFKSYEAGWQKFSSDDIDGIWWDEEPDITKIYTEGLARLIDRKGISMMTFTPLLGPTTIVDWFWPTPNEPRRHLTQMEIEDALHIPAEQRQDIINTFPEHEREARVRGIPILGEGRIFKIAESKIVCEPFKIPNHFAQLGGMDFGWDHPFGALRAAWDRDGDIVYVCNEYKERETTPPIHAAAIKPWGDWIPWAYPHDGEVHDKGSGNALANQYRKQGVRMLNVHSTFADGGFSTEAAVLDAQTRFKTGRLKIFRNLSQFFAEYRQYHRKDGRIVKRNDDLLSALWKILMMLRYARTNDIPIQPTMTEDFNPLSMNAV
jgi:phage terminase large subunit-like protein